MRRYVLLEDTIVEDNQRVTSIHPLFDAVRYTPFYLRYNTGLHISKNGQKFSEMMDSLFKTYPVNIEEIMVIGHSMGGSGGA